MNTKRTADRKKKVGLRIIAATVSVLLAEALFAGWSFASADRKLHETLYQGVSDTDPGDLLVLSNPSEMRAELQRMTTSATAGGLALVVGLVGLFFILLYCTHTHLCTQRRALRESEKRYTLLAEQSRTYTWEIDAKGLYTYVSHVMRGILGFRPDELVGKKYFYDLHPEDQRAEFKKNAFGIITRREPFLRRESRIQSKDGRTVWISTSGLPLLDAQGNLQGYRGSDTDITEQKRKEQKLRESECRMRAITDSARDAIVMMDPAGNIVFWNPAAERIFGYTGTEAIGQNLHALLAPQYCHPTQQEALLRFSATGQGKAVGKVLKVQSRRKDGEEIEVERALSAIEQPDGWHAVGIVRDISERTPSEG